MPDGSMPRLGDYEHLLLPALAHSTDGSTIYDVRADVNAGRALLWPGQDSAAVTSESHEMVLWLAGGRLAELLEMEKSAEAFARQRGFNRMCVEGGRPGWRRALKQAGYRELTTLVKDL